LSDLHDLGPRKLTPAREDRFRQSESQPERRGDFRPTADGAGGGATATTRSRFLSIDGTKVEDTKADAKPAGFARIRCRSARRAILRVCRQMGGGGAGDIDTNQRRRPGQARHRVSSITLDVGQSVEGHGVSRPTANYTVAVSAPERLSKPPPSNPFYNANGLVVVFHIDGTTSLTRVGDAKVGGWNQGVAWSRGRQDPACPEHMVENALSIISFDWQEPERSPARSRVNGRNRKVCIPPNR